MQVALFGGTGFVGSYIIRELIHVGYIPRVLVRIGSESKITSICEIVSGSIQDENVITNTIQGTDAIIYNIGIIREFPNKNITYEKLHYEGVKRCINLANKLDVKRFILMSANGVKPDGTGYQKTKWQAEEELIASDLEWTIFRPSLIFGDPGEKGNPEFCTQLCDDMLSLPIPTPLFYKGILPFNAGSFCISPIHVKNVAEFFVKTINRKKDIGKIYDLGGPETLMWKEIVHQIALAFGKLTWKVPAPVIALKMAAAILDRFNWFPVTHEQLTMLMEGNTVRDQYFTDFKIDPIFFEKNNLSYLKK